MCHHKPPSRWVTEIPAMLARPSPSPQGLRPSEIALFFPPATCTPGKTKLNYIENFQRQGVLHPAAYLSLEGKRATLPCSHHHLGKQPTEAGSPRPQGPLPQVRLSNMHPPNPRVCSLPLPHTGSLPRPLPGPLPSFHPPEHGLSWILFKDSHPGLSHHHLSSRLFNSLQTGLPAFTLAPSTV